MNLQIEIVKQNIINTINNSGLPIGVIHYLLKDISNGVADEYNRVLMFEQQQRKEQKSKEQAKTDATISACVSEINEKESE